MRTAVALGGSLHICARLVYHSHESQPPRVALGGWLRVRDLFARFDLVGESLVSRPKWPCWCSGGGRCVARTVSGPGGMGTPTWRHRRGRGHVRDSNGSPLPLEIRLWILAWPVGLAVRGHRDPPRGDRKAFDEEPICLDLASNHPPLKGPTLLTTLAKRKPEEAALPPMTAGVKIARENRAACDQIAVEQRAGLTALAMTMFLVQHEIESRWIFCC